MKSFDAMKTNGKKITKNLTWLSNLDTYSLHSLMRWETTFVDRHIYILDLLPYSRGYILNGFGMAILLNLVPWDIFVNLYISKNLIINLFISIFHLISFFLIKYMLA